MEYFPAGCFSRFAQFGFLVASREDLHSLKRTAISHLPEGPLPQKERNHDWSTYPHLTYPPQK